MQKVRFFVPGPLPGLNEVINSARGTKGRGSLVAASSQKKTWTSFVSVIIRTSNQNFEMFTVPVFVDMFWVEEHKRRDPDNIVSAKKYIFDGMVQAGLIKNDGWKQIDGFRDRWTVNRIEPGVLVTVTTKQEDL